MKPLLALLFVSVLAACSDSAAAAGASSRRPSSTPRPSARLPVRSASTGAAPPAETDPARRRSEVRHARRRPGARQRRRRRSATTAASPMSSSTSSRACPRPAIRLPAQPVVLDQEAVPLRAARARAAGRAAVDDPQQRSAAAQRARRSHASTTPSTSARRSRAWKCNRTLATREVMVPVKCNVHPWMHAYVGVLEHPFFAVTDADGRVLDSQPSRRRPTTIETWHEQFRHPDAPGHGRGAGHHRPDARLQGVVTWRRRLRTAQRRIARPRAAAAPTSCR